MRSCILSTENHGGHDQVGEHKRIYCIWCFLSWLTKAQLGPGVECTVVLWRTFSLSHNDSAMGDLYVLL
jgi:hypothetical protein